MTRLLEDIVICIAVALGLLIALLLSWLMVQQGADYPPTLISAFLGIAIAALTYRFLGGTSTTEFSMGALKLGGSAALLIGTTWFVGDRLRDEIRLYDSMDTYRQQIATLEEERAARGDEADKLRRQIAGAPGTRGALTIAEIRKLKPDDPLIRDIRKLVDGQEGPFRQTIRDLAVRVSVIAAGGDSPQFNICSDTLEALNEGVDVPGTEVLVSRTLEDGTPVSVRAQRAGRIGQDVCGNQERAFDAQVSCPVALVVFRDILSNCADGNSVRGMRVTFGLLTT